jgi:hypothetical protein
MSKNIFVSTLFIYLFILVDGEDTERKTEYWLRKGPAIMGLRMGRICYSYHQRFVALTYRGFPRRRRRLLQQSSEGWFTTATISSLPFAFPSQLTAPFICSLLSFSYRKSREGVAAIHSAPALLLIAVPAVRYLSTNPHDDADGSVYVHSEDRAMHACL